MGIYLYQKESGFWNASQGYSWDRLPCPSPDPRHIKTRWYTSLNMIVSS